MSSQFEISLDIANVTIESVKINKETVKAFLSSMPKRLRRGLKAVCSDLYEGYINAAKEVFGKGVRVIADRFHVAKLHRRSLDELRKAPQGYLWVETGDFADRTTQKG